jgi:hypothetical protein
MALLRSLPRILAAIRDLSANGLISRTSATTVAARTITGTADQIVVADGDGASGNPTLSTPQDIDTSAGVQFATVTAGGATGLGGEFQALGTTTASATIENTGNGAVNVNLDADRSAAGNALARLRGAWNNNVVATVVFLAGDDDGTSKDNGEIGFYTSDSGSNPLERARFVQDGGLFFQKNSGNPTARSNKAAIYAKDVSASTEMFVMDEAGNVTQISPHDPDTGKLVILSENVFTGETVRVELEDAIADLAELTGRTYIQRGRLDAGEMQTRTGGRGSAPTGDA